MIRIERTTDKKLITSVLHHPIIWGLISDDFNKTPSEIYVDDSIIYLAAFKNDKLAGIMAAHPLNAICFEGHTNIHPDFWGENTKEITQKSMEWLFKNTECQCIQVTIPEKDKQVINHVLDIGFKPIGTRPKSILKNGKALNERLFYYAR